MSTALDKEFDAAYNSIRHSDDMIAKVTSGYLTLAGLIGPGVGYLLSMKRVGNESSLFTKPEFVVAALFVFVGMLGLVVVKFISELRAHQKAHLLVISEIRKALDLPDSIRVTTTSASEKCGDMNLWSASFLWTFIVVLFSCEIFSLGVYFAFSKGWNYGGAGSVPAGILGLCLFILEIHLHFRVTDEPSSYQQQQLDITAGGKNKLKDTQ